MTAAHLFVFDAFQAASNDHPWDNYRRFASFVQWTACWPACVHVTVAVARYRPTSSCHNIAKLINPTTDIVLLIWSLSRYQYRLSAVSLLKYRISIVPKISVLVWHYNLMSTLALSCSHMQQNSTSVATHILSQAVYVTVESSDTHHPTRSKIWNQGHACNRCKVWALPLSHQTSLLQRQEHHYLLSTCRVWSCSLMWSTAVKSFRVRSQHRRHYWTCRCWRWRPRNTSTVLWPLLLQH